MTTYARAAVYEGPNSLQVREFPLPSRLDDDALLVEIDLAGVDGSEIHILRGELENLNAVAPFVMGDELVGRIVEAGPAALADRGLQLGDRVVVEARWPCNACRACLAGEYYVCEKGKIGRGYGVTSSLEPPYLWGTYATHLYVPAPAMVYRVPSELPDETALIGGSVLANGIRWTGKAGVSLGHDVLVIGPGPQGIACALVATMRGAAVTLVGLERDTNRLELARKFGVAHTAVLNRAAENSIESVDVGSKVFDIVIEAAGAQSAKDYAMAHIRNGGTIANCSLTDPHRLEIDFYAALTKSVTLLNVASHPHTIDKALALATTLHARGIDVGQMVTDVFSLEHVEIAMRTAAYELDTRPVKVALRM